MMVITPDMVKMKAAAVENPEAPIPGCKFVSMFDVNFDGFNYGLFRYSGEDTKTGSYGNPMAASAQKGQQVIDAWVENITAFISNFKKFEPFKK